MPAEEKEAEAEVGGGEKGGEQCTLPLYILPLDLPDDCHSFPNLPVLVVLVSLSLGLAFAEKRFHHLLFH